MPNVLARWLVFFSAAVAFFLFLPWANKVRKWLIGVAVYGDVHLGDVVLALGTAGVVAAICLVLLPRIVGRRRGRARRLALWLGAGLLLAGVGRQLQWAEWFHPFQYSLLSLLALWALRPHFPAFDTEEGALRDEGIYLVAAALAGLLGVLDEIVQWWLPTRVFDFRDIGLNLLVVVLVQALAWRGVEHAGRSGASRRSLVAAAWLWALLSFLCFLCASNSVDAIRLYRDLLPAGSRLGERAHTVMSVPEWIGRSAFQGILGATTAVLLLLALRLRRRLPPVLRLPPSRLLPPRRRTESGDR